MSFIFLLLFWTCHVACPGFQTQGEPAPFGASFPLHDEFIFGPTPADLLAASMAADPLYPLI